MSENEMPVGEPQGEIDLNSLDDDVKRIIASENFQKAALDEFRENTIQSKEALLTRMKQARVRFQQETASEEKEHSAAFYAIHDATIRNSIPPCRTHRHWTREKIVVLHARPLKRSGPSRRFVVQ